MSDHECTIGIMWDYEDSELVSAESFIEWWKGQKDFLRRCPEFEDDWNRPAHLREYADRRRSTRIEQFDYCPVCGKKIDWKELRKRFAEEEAKYEANRPNP